MLGRSRYEPMFRVSRLQSEGRMLDDRVARELYLSPQPSLDPDRLRYKLATPTTSKNTSIYSRLSRQDSRALNNRLRPLRHDISELEQELEYKRSLQRHLERQELADTTPYQTYVEHEEALLRRKTEEGHYDDQPAQPVWQNPDVFRTTRKKTKIYKIKSKKPSQLPPLIRDISEELPVIDRIRLGRSSRRDHDRHYLYELVKEPPIGKIYTKRRPAFALHARLAAYRTFRRAVHAVLFTIYLRKFNERMRRNREGYFHSFVRDEAKEKLLQLKEFLVEHSQPFFLALIAQGSFDYAAEKDEPELRREKHRHLRQLIELELGCLDKCVRTIANREFFSELLYHTCRHGNYASSYEMFTPEELSLLCISPAHGYVSADSHLEHSALLSLVFMKILLFNILLQPSKLPVFRDYQGSPDTIFKNMRLIATILYELFIDIQDNFLEKADSVYTVGNWKKARTPIKPAKSMTVRAGFYQRNELISGLADHKYIKETYGTRLMVDYKNLVEGLVKLLHGNIVQLHNRIRRRYF